MTSVPQSAAQYVKDVLEPLLRPYEENWLIEGALDLADSLARKEYEDEYLHNLGEELGDVDNNNLNTAYASTARRTTEALCAILETVKNFSGAGLPPLISEKSNDPALESLDGIQEVYELIADVLEEVFDDGLNSYETAISREKAVGENERNPSKMDENGRVLGFSKEYLSPEPTSKTWVTEYSKDTAQIIQGYKDFAYDKAEFLLNTVIPKEVIFSAIADFVLGQGWAVLSMRSDDFFDYAIEEADNVIEGEYESKAQFEEASQDAARTLLEAARSFAASITAYKALDLEIETAREELHNQTDT